MLEAKFQLHYQLNKNLERNQLNRNGTDFFQICKVDTHVHLAGAFSGRTLLRFIKEKCKLDPNKPVLCNPDGQVVTLAQLMSRLQSRHVDSLNLDQMQAQAEASTFQVRSGLLSGLSGKHIVDIFTLCSS